jgi:hypothetical protein
VMRLRPTTARSVPTLRPFTQQAEQMPFPNAIGAFQRASPEDAGLSAPGLKPSAGRWRFDCNYAGDKGCVR